MTYQLSNTQSGKYQLISDNHEKPEAAVEAGNAWLKENGYESVDGWADTGSFHVCLYRGLNRPGLGRLIVESVRAKGNEGTE